jgi:uncharacterized protein YycO
MNTKKERQETFVLNLLDGMTQTQAYLKAYGGKSAKAASVNASRLMRQEHIQKRYQELKDRIVTDRIMSIQQRKERLTEIAAEDIIKGGVVTRSTNVSAIDTLNKMDGIYKDSSTIISNTQVVFAIGKGYERDGIDSPAKCKDII